MANNVSDLMANVSKFRFNPAGIQRSVLGLLSEITNGQRTVVDPTNPFVFCLEAAACCTAGFMQEHALAARQRYPRLAMTQEDLYLHMSDKDYADRFATPANATFYFLFPKEKLINSMVLEEETGYMKITIPRNTYFTVSGMRFSLQYPIDIRKLANDALQIVYDVEKPSPLQTLSTNAILPEIVTNEAGDWIHFGVETSQFLIQSQTDSISQSIDLTMDIDLTDQYYYARAFYRNDDKVWIEMLTTHADTVYDVTQPTAVLRLLGNKLLVKIPQIYVNSGALRGKIRVDVYQTRGAISMPLKEYPSKAVTIKWEAYDANDVTKFTAPLEAITVIGYSNDTVTDGADGMDFETLRTNVINNTVGPVDVSITPTQIKTALVRKGYEVTTNVDNVTNRVFLAVRSMPSPAIVTATTAVSSSGNQLLTAAAASIETLNVTTDQLTTMKGVIDNGTSLTLTPDMLYQIVDGLTVPVKDSVIASLKALPTDKRALAVTNGNFLYTPFHYVLDMTNNAFEMRPYYLDSPVVESKQFRGQNDTTLIQLTTDLFGILRTVNGYMIQIVTLSDDKYKAISDSEVFAQLSYTPYGERDRAYLNGVLVGKTDLGERIFNFDLSTTFNVDGNDNLELTKFTMYNTERRITSAALLESIDILYSTSETMSLKWKPNDIDQILGRHLLPQTVAGITRETLKVRFGQSLNMLWARARTVIGSTPVKTYATDVLAVYKNDVFLRDANGSAISIINGEPVTNYLHHKGDPILVDGVQAYEHRKGDVVLDANGNPVPASERGLMRQLDMLLIDATYIFATDSTTTTYRQNLTEAVVKWLVSDLASFKGKLLDLTRIYFYPKTTSGVIKVMVGDRIQKAMMAGQSFNVSLSVSKTVFDNADLRELLTRATVTTIARILQSSTVSSSEIVIALGKAYGDDVISVQVSGLGGNQNYPALTVLDATDRLSIRKRLVATADDTLVVEEDVTVSFELHNAA